MTIHKNIFNEKKPTIMVSGGFDPVHAGHIRMIRSAAKYGDVTVGLLTDKAIAEFKRLPLLQYNQRKMIIENIIGVKILFFLR